MGLFKSLLDLIGGKEPQIFDERGRVRHAFTDETWKKWDDRFKANPTYNWREHGAKERAQKPAAPVAPPPAPATTPAAAPAPAKT